ncbi:MAG: hypothetical protein J0G30_11745 [Actinomycetales bacterium]|nr:hypothetical protein [Actinomycetales bacterium]
MLRELSLPARVLDVGAALIVVALRLLIGTDGPAMALVVIAWGAAFALWRWSPPLALGIAWVAAVAQVAMSLPADGIDLLVLVVLFGTGRYGGTALRALGIASAALGALLAGFYLALVVPSGWGSVTTPAGIAAGGLLSVGFFGVFALSWAIGLVSGLLRQGAESRRERERAAVEIAAEQERTRLAREMHDVVAHSLAVVVAQADGARYAARSDPAAADAALATIADTAREALADVRLLLAQLRHRETAGPQPGLDELPRLLEGLRDSGLEVEAELDTGLDTLPRVVQSAGYRIVQESLVNALRHGSGEGPTRLRVQRRGSRLEIEVRNPRGPEREAPAVPGHGIPGMRERAALLGGDLEARGEPGGFVVLAHLPVDPRAGGPS